MLISWKRYWSEPADGIAVALKQYSELVAEIQSGAETLSPRGVENTLREALRGFQNPLVSCVGELQKAHHSVISSVRTYFEEIGEFISSRETEVKELVSLIGQEVAGIASESQQHHNRLTGFTDVLQRVGQSRDVREMRRRLTDEVTQIRSYVDGMHEANRVTIRNLEQQLLALQDRLDRTEQAAYSDALTGLPNRRAGEERLRHMVAAEKSFCALLLDLNGFKQINDRWGHTCGDQVLEIIGKKLRAMVADATLVCRWGGDEFLVLAPGDLTHAHECSAALQKGITGRYTIVAIGRTFDVDIGVSIGIAEHRQGDTDRELVGRADADLYDCKQKAVSNPIRQRA